LIKKNQARDSERARTTERKGKMGNALDDKMSVDGRGEERIKQPTRMRQQVTKKKKGKKSKEAQKKKKIPGGGDGVKSGRFKGQRSLHLKERGS